MTLQLPPSLEHLRQRIEAARSTCIVLSPALERTARGTHFGGEPLLPAGVQWPRSDRGPLSFVGQLDFEELAAVGGTALGLPAQGLVAVFYDVEAQPWGTEADHSDGFALIRCADRRTATRAEMPEDVIPFDEEPLVASAAFSLPAASSAAGAALLEGQSREVRAAYERLVAALYADQVPHGVAALRQQVGGHAPFLGSDGQLAAALASRGISARDLGAVSKRDMALARQEAADWQLLWQLEPHDDRYTWAATGSLFVLVHAGSLERAWLIYQPG